MSYFRRFLIPPTGFNPATDTSVVEWADSTTSGNTTTNWIATVGQNFTSSLAAPTLPTNVKNGNQAYLFNGVTQFLGNPVAFTNTAQPYWTFFVFSFQGAVAGWPWSDTSQNVALKVLSGALKAYANASSQTVIGSPDTNWHVLAVYFNGSISGYILDGGTFTTMAGSPGTNAITRVVIGAMLSQASPCNEYVGVFGLCSAANTSSLSSGTSVSSVMSYLNGRWAVY